MPAVLAVSAGCFLLPFHLSLFFGRTRKGNPVPTALAADAGYIFPHSPLFHRNDSPGPAALAVRVTFFFLSHTTSSFIYPYPGRDESAVC